MSVWYVAHSDELLIDLDDYMRPSKSGCPWGEAFFRRRLREAITARKLNVREVWLVKSNSLSHYQAIIRLEFARTQLERLIWQLHLGSDLYRGRADLMREARDIEPASLIILPHAIDNFYREPDESCPCDKKHVTNEQFQLGDKACPIWRKLRGMSPWELFGPSAQGLERFVPLPTGRIPMELIMKREKLDFAKSNFAEIVKDI